MAAVAEEAVADDMVVVTRMAGTEALASIPCLNGLFRIDSCGRDR